MMPYEGIRFQLLDLPAVSPEHPVPWLASTLQQQMRVCSSWISPTPRAPRRWQRSTRACTSGA